MNLKVNLKVEPIPSPQGAMNRGLPPDLGGNYGHFSFLTFCSSAFIGGALEKFLVGPCPSPIDGALEKCFMGPPWGKRSKKFQLALGATRRRVIPPPPPEM